MVVNEVMEDLFETESRFGKRIRLTGTIWQKIRTHHTEFQQEDYLEEIRQTVEEPADDLVTPERFPALDIFSSSGRLVFTIR